MTNKKYIGIVHWFFERLKKNWNKEKEPKKCVYLEWHNAMNRFLPSVLVSYNLLSFITSAMEQAFLLNVFELRLYDSRQWLSSLPAVHGYPPNTAIFTQPKPHKSWLIGNQPRLCWHFPMTYLPIEGNSSISSSQKKKVNKTIMEIPSLVFFHDVFYLVLFFVSLVSRPSKAPGCSINTVIIPFQNVVIMPMLLNNLM